MMLNTNKKIVVITVLTLICTFALQAFQFRFIKTVKLLQEPVLLAGPSSFFVTEDGLIFVPDFKLGNFKIYTSTGRFLKEFGKKGSGPNEFQKPVFSSYYKGKFAFFDYASRRVYIYKRIGKDGLDFEKKWEHICLTLGYGILLHNDDAIISGYIENPGGKSFALYSVNIKSGEKSFLIPSTHKFGMEGMPAEKFPTYYRNNTEIPAIGLMSYAARQGNRIYFAWEGNLKIITVDFNSQKISSFGRLTENYTRPKANRRLLQAYEQRDPITMQAEKKKFNYVRNVSACNDFVALVYIESIENGTASKLFFQFYTPDGAFIKEILFPEIIPNEPLIYFDRDNRIFYLMKAVETKEFNMEYQVSSYQVLNR